MFPHDLLLYTGISAQTRWRELSATVYYLHLLFVFKLWLKHNVSSETADALLAHRTRAGRAAVTLQFAASWVFLHVSRPLERMFAIARISYVPVLILVDFAAHTNI